MEVIRDRSRPSTPRRFGRRWIGFAAAAVLAATMSAPTAGGASPVPGRRSICDKVASPTGLDPTRRKPTRIFRTAQGLLNSLHAGQVGCLHGGTYTAVGEYVLDIAKSDVSIISYPGETASLQGIIVDRSGADRVRLANLRIVGTGVQNSIQVYGADFRLERSDVTNGWHGRSCLMLGDPSAGTALRAVIRGNRFHECGNPANGDLDHGIYASALVGGLITENEFWNIAGYAIQLYPHAQSTVFSHNVVDGSGLSTHGGVILGGETANPSSGNAIEYNIIAYAKDYDVTTWWGGSAGTGNVASFNCLYAGGKGTIGPTDGLSTLGNVTAPPLFVNRRAHDYRLQPGSKCLSTIGYASVRRR